MNKTELIDAIAAQADISKAAAGRALDAAVESITAALQKGDSVSLIGFGTFYVGERAARTGRNPRTGEAVEVAEKFVPFFKTGKELRERLNVDGDSDGEAEGDSDAPPRKSAKG